MTSSQTSEREDRPVVGLDFDNTVVDYGPLFHEAAVSEGLLPAGAPVSKRFVRDAIRSLPDGEMSWRSVQARVYGLDIAKATPQPGVREFLARLGRLGLSAYVVSHKTPTASYQGEPLDLRRAALGFLAETGLFDPAWSPLAPNRVFFESTRREKGARIASLGCTVFVDDLVEVFLDPSFPVGVRQLLYLPEGEAPKDFTGTLCRDWARVSELALGEDAARD